MYLLCLGRSLSTFLLLTQFDELRLHSELTVSSQQVCNTMECFLDTWRSSAVDPYASVHPHHSSRPLFKWERESDMNVHITVAPSLPPLNPSPLLTPPPAWQSVSRPWGWGCAPLHFEGSVWNCVIKATRGAKNPHCGCAALQMDIFTYKSEDVMFVGACAKQTPANIWRIWFVVQGPHSDLDNVVQRPHCKLTSCAVIFLLTFF